MQDELAIEKNFAFTADLAVEEVDSERSLVYIQFPGVFDLGLFDVTAYFNTQVLYEVEE